MDFRQPSQPGTRPAGASAPANPTINNSKPHRGSLSDEEKKGKLLRLMTSVILFGIAILIAAVAFTFTRSNSHNEYKFVNTGKYQAVFLTNGQVYFGHISNINDKYVQLDNIYYLTQSSSATSSSSSSNSNYTLVKLGCQQIHDPFDEMVINRDQVTFWENLQDSGKVVASINQYKASVKNETPAQICAQVSSQTQASPTSTSTQGTTSTTTKP